MGTEGEYLIGIKAIAQYLDLSVRSVYRWEKEYGLPLHRTSGAKGTRVLALKEELDQWLVNFDGASSRNSLLKNTLWILSFMVILIGLIAALLLLGVIKLGQEPSPTHVKIRDNLIVITDEQGDEIWLFAASSYSIAQKNLTSIIDFRDIDDDGFNEVAAATYDISRDQFRVTLFDNDGTRLWDRRMSSEISFNGIKLRSFFLTAHVKFAQRSNGETVILSRWNHRERFLGVIACHDIEGELTNSYLHKGNVSSMKLCDLDADGEEEIVFAGTNNLLNGEGVFGILSIDDFNGISPPYKVEPEYEDLSNKLINYIEDKPDPGIQKAYFRFKKLIIMPELMPEYIVARVIYADSASMHIRLAQWRISKNETLAIDHVFSSSGHLKAVLPTPSAEKILPGFLNSYGAENSLDEIKELCGRSVLRWSGAGWEPVQIAMEGEE